MQKCYVIFLSGCWVGSAPSAIRPVLASTETVPLSCLDQPRIREILENHWLRWLASNT